MLWESFKKGRDKMWFVFEKTPVALCGGAGWTAGEDAEGQGLWEDRGQNRRGSRRSVTLGHEGNRTPRLLLGWRSNPDRVEKLSGAAAPGKPGPPQAPS